MDLRSKSAVAFGCKFICPTISVRVIYQLVNVSPIYSSFAICDSMRNVISSRYGLVVGPANSRVLWFHHLLSSRDIVLFQLKSKPQPQKLRTINPIEINGTVFGALLVLGLLDRIASANSEIFNAMLADADRVIEIASIDNNWVREFPFQPFEIDHPKLFPFSAYC